MGRPRKHQAVPTRPAHRPAAPLEPAPPPPIPDLVPDDEPLYPVEGPEIMATHFGRVTTKWQRWRLIREGKLPAVYVGRRVFLRASVIRQFIDSGGAK